jgi:hypothetical protein
MFSACHKQLQGLSTLPDALHIPGCPEKHRLAPDSPDKAPLRSMAMPHRSTMRTGLHSGIKVLLHPPKARQKN